MENTPQRFGYESMGTGWEVTIWDEMDEKFFNTIKQRIMENTDTFDRTFSRFRPDSFISKISKETGMIAVPEDLTKMLRLYMHLHEASGGKLNPLIGHTLSDLGYDAEYSLTPKKDVRIAPDLPSTIRIVDDTHIEQRAPVLIDLGALGKGFFVDRIADILDSVGMKRYLVNGSGDIRYRGEGFPLRAGLEHPLDASKVIGILPLQSGALCASASNRRRWNKYHHTIDPHTSTSPEGILATWVKAPTAAIADALCTCLFLTEPRLYEDYVFEYCILDASMHVVRSRGFDAELF